MIEKITHRPLWVNFIVALIIAAGLFFIFIVCLKWITQHGKSRTVPSVMGKSFDEAKNMLEDMGFEVVVQDSIYIDTLEPYAIIKQIPDPDASVKVNRTVYLTVNRSVPPFVEMPNLVGYSIRNAEMVLENMGLRIKDTVYKPDFAKNSVLEQLHNGQHIPPGTKLQMGSSISLVLGSGVGTTEFNVPNLIGLTYYQARSRLEANGLLLIPIVLDPSISDTLNAFVGRQEPSRLDEVGKKQKIRPGQMMTVWLQRDRPVIDSVFAPEIQQPD